MTASMCSAAGLVSLLFYHIVLRYVITLTGICSNIFLITGLIMDPLQCFRNSSSCLVMNLGLSDILTSGSAFLLLYLHPCIDGHEISFDLPSYVASTSIFTMACDRYLSSVYPFKYRVIITRKITLIAILLQWFLCSAYFVFEMFFVRFVVYSRCICAFIILLGATGLYGKAAYVLKKNSRYLKSTMETSTATRGGTQSSRIINEKRFLKTMLLVSIVTVATVAPVSIYELFIGISYVVNEHSDVRERDFYQIWLRTWFLVNFSINPFMYAWRLTSYRETFRMLLLGDHHFGQVNRGI